MTQLALQTETWESKARRLAEELWSLRTERDALECTTKRWGDLTRQIRDKRHEIEQHLAGVAS